VPDENGGQHGHESENRDIQANDSIRGRCTEVSETVSSNPHFAKATANMTLMQTRTKVSVKF
jgi:hypothetical protein